MLTAQEDSGQHHTLKNPCLYTWATTVDPPFCTHISLRTHPFAHVTSKILKLDWLLPVKVVPDQRMLVQELTLYNVAFRCVQHHSELIFFVTLTKMEKAEPKSPAPMYAEPEEDYTKKLG